MRFYAELAARPVAHGDALWLTVKLGALSIGRSSSEYRSLKLVRKKFRLHIALMMAMALLIAQLGGQAHAYSHLNVANPTDDAIQTHLKPCPECLSFAPLLAPAGSPSPLSAIAPQGIPAAPNAAAASLISRSPTPAFRSRAPPSPR